MSAVYAEESDPQGMYSFSALYEAYLACRKRKRNTIDALHFEHGLLENLTALGETLRDGSYQPARSVCFVTDRPKLREIFAADFRDRVAHHLLVPRLERVFEPIFIHDSFACRKGKGTHAAVERLRSFMRGVTLGGRVPAWFLQLDIRSFFTSIDKNSLFGIIRRQVKDEAVLELTRRIIMHDCARNYVYKGEPGLLAKVPAHKTLFHAPGGTGLPIGNLTSQFFANVYLNELDQFVKHTLKAGYYLRYVDDFIVLDRSRDALLDVKRSIERFLADRLRLTLKEDYTLKRVSEGADFLGYIARPEYMLARNRVVGNLRYRLEGFEKSMVRHPLPSAGAGRGEGGGWLCSPMPAKTAGALRQTLASYLGHFKHANTRRLARSIFTRYHFLSDVLALATGRNEYKLRPLTEPMTTPGSFREQYRWFERKFPEACMFLQAGRYFELHGSQAERYAGVLGLKAGTATRALGAQCGFPVGLLDRYKSICLRKGIDYVVVAEHGWYPSGLKKRVVVEIGRRPGKKLPEAAA